MGDPKTGIFSVTNKNFEQYYSRFVLIYASWLASKAMMITRNEFPTEWPEEEEDSFSILLALFVKPAVYHRAPCSVENLRGSVRYLSMQASSDKNRLQQFTLLALAVSKSILPNHGSK